MQEPKRLIENLHNMKQTGMTQVEVESIAIMCGDLVADAVRPIIDRLDRMETITNTRFDKMDERFDKMETTTNTRLDRMEATTNTRFDRMEATTNTRFDRMEATTNTRFDKIETTTNTRFDKIDERLDEMDKRFDKMDSHLKNYTFTHVILIIGFIGIVATLVT